MKGVIFCSYADTGYADRLIALLLSARQQNCKGESWWILALDDEIQGIVQKALPDFEGHWIKIGELDNIYSELYHVRKYRPKWDGFLTARCHFVRRILDLNDDGKWVVCLDADMCFFSPLDDIFKELKGAAVGVTPHRFPRKIRASEQYGKYNAGITFFRNGEIARSCVLEWCKDCIRECSSESNAQAYTDQKYLDSWEKKFSGVRSITHLGVNAAPWNVDNYNFEYQDNNISLDKFPLVIYHFHEFREVVPGFFYHGLAYYKAIPEPILLKGVYQTYCSLLSQARNLIGKDPSVILIPKLSDKDHSQKSAYSSSHWAIEKMATYLDWINWEKYGRKTILESIMRKIIQFTRRKRFVRYKNKISLEPKQGG